MLGYFRLLSIRYPEQSLSSLTKYVMTSRRIIPMPPLKSENSSYQSTFQAPCVQCHNVMAEKVAAPYWNSSDQFDFEPFMIYWEKPLFEDEVAALFVNWSDLIGYYKGDGQPIDFARDSFEPVNLVVISENHALVCYPYTAMYTANMSYDKGVQTISYALLDVERFNFANKKSLIGNRNFSS